MSYFDVSPVPGVVISDDDEQKLPLLNFNIVVIVEPDPYSYMPFDSDLKKLGELIYFLYSRFEFETDLDNILEYPGLNISKNHKSIFIWLTDEDQTVNYFKDFAQSIFSRVIFNLIIQMTLYNLNSISKE